MAKGYATRRYQLTINNPQEHGYDHNVIKAALEKGAKLLYWCMADEVGQEETYHIHLFLVYENPVMFTTLKNKFPTAHIEVPQWGKNSENYAYIRKEGAKYNKDANGHYKYTDSKGKVHEGINYSDTFEESGSLPPDSKQGDRNDLRTLYALIASGADNAQILGEHPEYLRDISHIDRTRQTILEEKYRNVFRQMTVTYIFGPTGTGKTRSVKEGCGYSNCYAVSDYHHPFDGYRGQKVMLFDEFHSSLPLNSMLQYLDSDTKIVLGINAAGIPVSIDFSQLPHWLLAAATGMGKTQLALLILYQLSQKGYDIYLADYKGVDFGPEYRKTGHYADDDAALEQMLDSVVHELNHRRTEFSIAGCANLEEYVQTTGEELHRIVVILDETSMILDTTGRDKDGKAVVASITNKLLAIGRLGRALGIHLLVATQRPDVGSVPGSLKAQLDGRICGHTADAQSSIVILDDGSAAKLPAIPGRFIIRNGSGSDEIIQAYYYHQ